MRKASLGFLLLIFISSCAIPYYILFGITKPKSESISEQLIYLKKNNIQVNEDVFKINHTYYDSLNFDKFKLDSIPTVESISPVQVRVYDNLGNLVSGWEVCFGKIEHFFPLTSPPDSLVTFKSRYCNNSLKLENDLSLINLTSDQRINLNRRIENSDYIFIVLWEKSLGIFSKKTLKHINKYIENHAEKKKMLFLKLNTSN